MKVWVDADAAPREVKDIVLRASQRREFDVLLVANRPLAINPGYSRAKSIVVRDGANEADHFIAEHSAEGDIAITADIPLAEQLVNKDVSVIDPRGEQYSAETIASRMSMRSFMDSLRGSGMDLGGAAPYSDRDKQNFACTFDRLLTKAIAKQSKS